LFSSSHMSLSAYSATVSIPTLSLHDALPILLALSITQRHRELALLRAVGATPRQVRRLIVGETLVLAVLATALAVAPGQLLGRLDRKSTRLNSSHVSISYAVFCLKKKTVSQH